MRFRKYKQRKLLILSIIFMLVCMIVPLNVISVENNNSFQENKLDFGMKRLSMKADCSRILLYKVWWFPVHMGSFWFTSKYAYLCFFIDKDVVLKINDVQQEIDLPAMIIPWRYIGYGPIWNPSDPCDGNVSLNGMCEKIIIKPYTS